MECFDKRNGKRFGRIANRMAKCLLVALALLLLSGLTACSDDGWKDYDTPERFLAHSIEHHYITVTSTEIDGEVMDYDLKIKDSILEIGDFEVASKRETKSEHYVSYEILIALSTAGPNYSHMHIYDDGYLEIVYKSALGKQHWFYYSFNPDEAAALVERIEDRIRENLQKQEEVPS